MRKLGLTALALGFLTLGSSSPASAQMEAAEMRDVEIEATVVDLSCKLVYDLSGEEMHRECAQVCADRGIPLGLVASDGTFYLPVTTGMPGEGANKMLRPHAEHKVKVKGKVLTRAGLSSIVIESISM